MRFLLKFWSQIFDVNHNISLPTLFNGISRRINKQLKRNCAVFFLISMGFFQKKIHVISIIIFEVIVVCT